MYMHLQMDLKKLESWSVEKGLSADSCSSLRREPDAVLSSETAPEITKPS